MGISKFHDHSDDYEMKSGGITVSAIYSEHLKNRDAKPKIKPKKKKKKKHRRYCEDIPDFHVSDSPPNMLDIEQFVEISQVSKRDGDYIPDYMLLDIHSDSGFPFGLKNIYGPDKYVGMPQGAEGNTTIIGGNGSGKSVTAKAALRFWRGSLCVTDIKGELSSHYAQLFEDDIVKRPFIVFDPMQTDGIGYDPFWWLMEDDEENLINNIKEIVLAIIPLLHSDKQPFWVETEQAIFAAALHYYYKLGSSFSETVTEIMSSNVIELVDKLEKNGGVIEKMFLGSLTKMKDEVVANFDRGLRNKLMLFATDPYISNAFRGSREGARCFNWGDMDECNIFLKIPGNKIEQWGGAVTLMLTQLIRHMERRPDKNSPEGANLLQTMLLLDEIARFGKLEMLPSAISTLRSKCVNFCLMIQSMAQLDKFYGEHDRCIILDNCQYIAILRANDPKTQRCLSELIGTHIVMQRSYTENLDDCMNASGYSRQISSNRESLIFPHELAELEDVLLLIPKGFCRAEKIQHDTDFSASKVLPAEAEYRYGYGSGYSVNRESKPSSVRVGVSKSTSTTPTKLNSGSNYPAVVVKGR